MTATVALGFRGTAWKDDLALAEQPGVAQHLAFMGGLLRRGVLESAGPFAAPGEQLSGDVVGLLLFAEAELEEASRILDDDPAAQAGLVRWQVQRWHR